jgi:hypothetical protein
MPDNTTLLVAALLGAEVWGDLPGRLSSETRALVVEVLPLPTMDMGAQAEHIYAHLRRHHSGSTPPALVVGAGLAAGPCTHFVRAGQAERLLLVEPDTSEILRDLGIDVPEGVGPPTRMHPSFDGMQPDEIADVIAEGLLTLGTDDLTTEQRTGLAEALRRSIRRMLPPDPSIRAEAPPRWAEALAGIDPSRCLVVLSSEFPVTARLARFLAHRHPRVRTVQMTCKSGLPWLEIPDEFAGLVREMLPPQQ